MRRRLIQLLVVLIAAGAVIGTLAPAEAGGWCVEFYACEPSGPCSEEPTRSDYYRYVVCCDTYGNNCDDGERTWISCC